MPIKRPLIIVTGPSSFTSDLIKMAENFLNANFVLLYHNNADNIAEWLDRADGAIIAGGVDIHPTVYNNSLSNGSNFSKFDLDRDHRELVIIDHCMKNKKPMLGICRGHQMIGVYLGMDIIADITDGDIAHAPHKQGINLNSNEPVHKVKLLGAKTMEYYNSSPPKEREKLINIPRNKVHDKEIIWVNSYHHQAVKYYDKANIKDRKWDQEAVWVNGIAHTGMKGDDEIIELMSGKNLPWLSTQWHPELDYETSTPSLRVLEKFKGWIYGNEVVA